MRLVIFDFDGTIHLKETPRLYLHIFKEDKLIMHSKIIKFYLSVAWVYALSRIGLCRQLMIKRVVRGISRLMRGMTQTQIDDFFKKCLEEAKKNKNCRPVSVPEE
jgi:hypothetical protein